MRARRSELFVFAFLARHGFSEIHHDVLCAGVQLDLIARSPRGPVAIVEVKMQTQLGLAHVSRRQRARLARAASRLSECAPVELWLALVEGERVRMLPLEAFVGGVD